MTGTGGLKIPTEREVQRSILAMCGRLFPDVLLHHSPAGAHLAGNDTARFKQMGALIGDGLKKGFPDLVAIWSGGVAFMEVKRPFGPRGGGGGEVSPEQEAMLAKLASMDHPVAIVRSRNEARDFLIKCGAPCRGELA